MTRRYWGYLIRFTLLHVVTYTVIGVFFYQLQDYKRAFEAKQYFQLFRPMDHPLVMNSMFIQILRGSFLAIMIHPFYNVFMNRKHKWLLLFELIFGLTALGSIVFIPNLVMRSTEMSLRQVVLENIIGLLEIIVQILLFSGLFIRWEKKSNKTINRRNFSKSLGL